MNLELILYLVSILCCTFAVSGLNISHIFKTNHLWEARFFIIILIFGMSYLLESFLVGLINIF